MLDKINPPEPAATGNPPVGYHFMVVFFIGGVSPNPIDIRFRKVSGLSAEIETWTLKEGGENLYIHRLPNRVKYGNLLLERGMVIKSPLNIEFNIAMTSLKFAPGNVMVTLLNDDSAPISAWLFIQSYPVKWSVSDLNADRSEIVIDKMELAYTRFRILRV